MYILFMVLGLIIGLASFYLFNKYKKPKKETISEEQKKKLEKLKSDFSEIMTYSIEKAVKNSGR